MEAGACPLERVPHCSTLSGSIIRHKQQAIATPQRRSNEPFPSQPSSSFLLSPLSKKLSTPFSSSPFQHGSSYLTSAVQHGNRLGSFNFSSSSSSSSALGTIAFDCSGSRNLTTNRTFPARLEHKLQTYRTPSAARGSEVGKRFFAADQKVCQLSQSVCPLRRTGRARSRGGLPQLCGAVGQSGTGQPVPEEENPEPASEQASPDSPIEGAPSESDPREGDWRESPPESDPLEGDWRAFRARLVVFEGISPSDETGKSTDGKETGSVPLGTRWAHPILAPEAGCVLIATDKIDGQQSFERSVILLLSPGSSNPREGPYGLILNRPLSCRIKDIRPKDRTLVKFFGNCQVHHGGPLDEDMFLLLHGTPGVKGYREVIEGVYYGAANGLEEIMKGNHLLDYRFFFGYSGWGVEQLKKEIDAGLWFVAACSTDLITGHSAAGLWEEVLLLMGGKYAELSKRPRRRHF